jgi:hypothetical protein
LLERLFLKGEDLCQQKRGARSLSQPALSYRLHRYFSLLLKKEVPGRFSGGLILILDGVHFKFRGKDWVLYLRGLKPINQDKVFFLNPILMKGSEAYRRWKKVIRTLPREFYPRIKALVSDGFPGSHRLALENGWVYQRCQFHLLFELRRRCGWGRRYTPDKELREKLFETIKEALSAKDKRRLEALKERIEEISLSLSSSWKLQYLSRSFIREIDSFRAYLLYPELNLPRTTSALESMSKIIRKRMGCLSTPSSLKIWAKILVRMRPFINCHGYITNQIN